MQQSQLNMPDKFEHEDKTDHSGIFILGYDTNRSIEFLEKL
jgi:hypothetical protein